MSKLQDNKFNECYVAINEKASGKGSLKDLTCAVKDNVVVANYPTTSGSETMSNFVSNYDATIVSLLKEAGANIVGKVALDELGMGATGEFSFKGPVVNPLNKEYQTGGSSSGSAVAVCNGTDFSIGTDTGDSIRIPAEFTKIIGLKPSYGALSRFGVVPYASSLDHAGYFTKSFDLMTKLIEVTMKHDANDLTSVDYSKVTPVAPTKLGEAKVAFLVDVYNNAPGNIKKDFDVVLNKLKDAGVKIQEVSFDKKVYDAIADTYAIIANVEGLQSTFAIDGIN